MRVRSAFERCLVDFEGVEAPMDLPSQVRSIRSVHRNVQVVALRQARLDRVDCAQQRTSAVTDL